MNYIPIVLASIILMIVFSFLGALILVPMWNYTMPELFGLKFIGFWQAWRLCMIGQIFKGSSSSYSSE